MPIEPPRSDSRMCVFSSSDRPRLYLDTFDRLTPPRAPRDRFRCWVMMRLMLKNSCMEFPFLSKNLPVQTKFKFRPAVAIKTPTRSTGALSGSGRSEEHTSELQSRFDLVCRLLLEK